jgi:hypothetical protein
MVVVVADGAGSAHRGADGAAMAAADIMAQAQAWLECEGTVSKLDARRVLEWIDGVREHIADNAGADGLEMRDYATTLLLALVDQERSVFAQIGDGAIVTSDAPGEWDTEFWPQRGVYANQTFFITDDGLSERLFFAHGLRPIRELAVFSDGLERVLLNNAERRAHAPVFEKMMLPLRKTTKTGHLFQLSEALATYLTSSAISARTDDDITLVLATKI